MSNAVSQIQIPAPLQRKLRAPFFPTTLSQTMPDSIYGPPWQVIYAEDFEGKWSNSYLSPPTGGLGTTPSGWGFIDNDTGCYRMITEERAVRGSRSLFLRSPTIAGGKADIHKYVNLPGGTKFVRLEHWFLLSNNSRNQGGNFKHVSLEVWGDNNIKYESILSYYPNGTNWAVGANFGGAGVSARMKCDGEDNNSEPWHYVAQIIDLTNLISTSVIVDDQVLTGLANTALRQLSDGSYANIPKPLRIEFGPINGGVHNSPTDDWWMAVDDIVVSVLT